MIRSYWDLSGKPCRRDGAYGGAGKKKGGGFGEIEDQNDFIIRHVLLGKGLPEQTKLSFCEHGMRFGQDMLPAKNVWQARDKSHLQVNYYSLWITL
jgi:hypothetical protein